MFSRRSIMKLFGLAAATPEVALQAFDATPIYDPVTEVVTLHGVYIPEVERLSDYGQRLWIDWARNAVPVSRFEHNGG